MVRCAVAEAEKGNVEVVRCHSSSQTALEEILKSACNLENKGLICGYEQ